ncbi:unnamed protein product, partial [Penicillium salamii]
MLLPITILYLLWAIVLSETLFHRVWSFSLFTLSWLTSDIFSLSNYSISKLLLIMLNILICAALSPLQVLLFQGSVRKKRERITTFFPSDDISGDTFLADIVYVHGLASDPRTTTESRSSKKVSWVRDLLPQEKLNCRIMAFNHDSRWKSNALSKSLKDFGYDLFLALSIKRQNPECVVGMVQRDNPDDREILDSLRGFVFLGTPHRGSKLTPIGEMISLLGYWRGSDTTLLKAMRTGSKENDELHDHIFSFIRKRELLDATLCIFETESEKIWGLPITHVVDRKSAVIQDSIAISAETSHKEMQRYDCEVDETYEDMVRYIKRWLKVESDKQNAMGRKPTSIYSVPPKTVPSYIQRHQLWKDLEEKLKVRHEGADIPYAVVLHGLGGSGKSQLALKYAERKRDEFNPILWIDATNQELFRSSFIRCATELGLSDDQKPQKDTRLHDDPMIRLVLRWLHDRTGEDPEWLVIFDNVDDLRWLKDVIPEGTRGRLIITSQDITSLKLLRQGCEKVHVDAMSPQEARMVLLQHFSQGPNPALEKVCQRCDEVAQKLGYLALAVDLAGAYISNYDVAPGQAPEQAAERALMQYLKDFKKHGDELLQKDEFQGLSKERKTVWTVWDTTLERIEKDHTELPGVLLSFLAHFRGSIVQDEVFRLASLGISAVDDELGEQNSPGLRIFIPQDEEDWDRFRYNQSIDVLARYSLVQRVYGNWPGTTMHSLVQWRATRGDQHQKWQGWYIRFMLAACSQLIKDHQPQFRRHLILHLPDVNIDLRGVSTKETGEAFIWATLGTIYSDEGWWADAERFQLQVMETSKTKLGEDHPSTLISMANLASTYRNQGRWEAAEQLFVQVMETRKTKLGEDHPNTLTSMANLASTYRNQGRWEAAEQLE